MNSEASAKLARRLVEAGAKGRKAIPEALQSIGDAAPLSLVLEMGGELEGSVGAVE